MTTQERVDQATLEELIIDYKRRFTDIKDIFVNAKKNTTVVLLVDGTKGIVKPCEGEMIDVRIGVLEALLKAREIRQTIKDFKSVRNNILKVELTKKGVYMLEEYYSDILVPWEDLDNMGLRKQLNYVYEKLNLTQYSFSLTGSLTGFDTARNFLLSNDAHTTNHTFTFSPC